MFFFVKIDIIENPKLYTLGLVTIRGRIVPDINNEDIAQNNKIEDNGYNKNIADSVGQIDHTQLKDELSILLQGKIFIWYKKIVAN